MTLQRDDRQAIRAGLSDNMERTLAHMARPGASWTSGERLRVAAEARRARADEPPVDGLSIEAIEAAHLLATHPADARREWVEQMASKGLDYPNYVELVGVVSRVVATDTFYEALGMQPPSLPRSVPGAPTGEIANQARSGKGWVPMVGGASITQALSLVPSENAELARFHGPMYLTFEEMSDPTIARGLTRPQMEVVASRTSALNECFY